MSVVTRYDALGAAFAALAGIDEHAPPGLAWLRLVGKKRQVGLFESECREKPCGRTESGKGAEARFFEEFSALLIHFCVSMGDR
jgi:hypothetical protein